MFYVFKHVGKVFEENTESFLLEEGNISYVPEFAEDASFAEESKEITKKFLEKDFDHQSLIQSKHSEYSSKGTPRLYEASNKGGKETPIFGAHLKCKKYLNLNFSARH